ncbi:ABC-type multidrug transport system, permease component [Hahella chejuensis KCTC 2396]|uniref:ABC-type multidrug transport system, permease component n=1 Tax=Hahella chejuensis (strain KCTC 2396) TaxID=349521 RepID=Q2SKM8_HAHCH|nr:ABC transporter permease [Hahella chejuensis]ABC28796.1 ABC-type multidrug transport system, permease component [Hahella chejuensis KCTC 2396]
MSSKLANIRRLGIKEIRSFLHDRALLIFVLAAFTIIVYSAATAASRELHNAPIAIVDEDQSQLSLRVANAFYPPHFKEPELISYADVDAGMDEGRYTFVVVIPSGLQKDVMAGASSDMQVNIDATAMTQAFIGATYIRSIVTAEVNEFVSGRRDEAALPIEQNVRVMFNPNLTGYWFGGVMEIISQITLLSIILTGAALIREKEHGTLEHLLVMPLSPLEIMAAKVWSNGLVVLLGAAMSLYVVIQGVLDVPIAGSVPLFLLGVALHLFSTTSMGIFLGTVARSMPQLGLLIILVILPMQLLSGGITPRESMPDIVQYIMLAAPTTHFVSFAQAIIYRSAGFSAVWPQFLAITVIGLALFLAALGRFRKMVETTQS